MVTVGFALAKGVNSLLLLEKVLPSWEAELAEDEKDSWTLYDTYDHQLLRRRSVLVGVKEFLRRLELRSFTLEAEVCPCPGSPSILSGKALSNFKLPVDMSNRQLVAVCKMVVNCRAFAVKTQVPLLEGQKVVSGRLLTLYNERFLLVDMVPDESTGEILVGELQAHNCTLLHDDWFMDLIVRHSMNIYRPVQNTLLIPSPVLSARYAVASLASGLLANARFFEKGICQDIDIECMHQYRLILRKLRSLLGLSKVIFSPEDYCVIADLVKGLGKSSLNLRDLDLQIESLPKQQSLLPPDQSKALAGWAEFLKTERSEVFQKVKIILESKVYRENVVKLERFLETWYKAPPQAWNVMNVGSLAATLISKTGKRVVKSCKSLALESADEDFHQLRISFKKLRYLLEFFEAMYPEKARLSLYKKVVEILTALGEFQDSAVRIEQVIEANKKLGTLGDDLRFATGMLAGICLEQHRAMKKDVFQRVKKMRQSLGKDLHKVGSINQTGASEK